jgi:hypothetical protein
MNRNKSNLPAWSYKQLLEEKGRHDVEVRPRSNKCHRGRDEVTFKMVKN